MSQELKQYVKATLERGTSKESVISALVSAGWAETVVQKTLEQFAGTDAHGIPIPAPRMQAHQIARDIFIYSLILVTLSLNACALGGLLFNLIDQFLPDPAFNHLHYWHRSQTDSMSWAIAQLVVAFPVFTGLMWWLQKDIAKFPQKRESLIRKLLIYLILGLTAVVGLGDLIAVLNTYLLGDITIRFACKALVVFGIALLIFVYYLFEMRQDDQLVQREGQP